MSDSKKRVVESTSREESTEPMLHIEANIRTSDISVDANGNLVITNPELAKLVEGFLCSDQAASMQKQAAHLLCCKLQCPSC